jgi:hypothetical protein
VTRPRRVLAIAISTVLVMGIAAGLFLYVRGRPAAGWTSEHRQDAERVCYLIDSNAKRDIAQCLCETRRLEHKISWATFVRFSNEAARSPGSDAPFQRLYDSVAAGC